MLTVRSAVVVMQTVVWGVGLAGLNITGGGGGGGGGARGGGE